MYLRTPSQRLIQAAAQVNWSRVLIVALAAFVLIGLAVATAGCQLKEPVDTDGDGVGDTSMTADQIEQWRARDAAKAKAEAEKVKADADATLKSAIAERDEQIRLQEAKLAQARRIARDAERAVARQNNANAEHVAQIQADAQDQIDDLGEQIAASIAAIKNASEAQAAKLTIDTNAAIAEIQAKWQKREDSRTIALSNIEANAGFIEQVANSGLVKAAANAIPFGNEILGLLGVGTVGGVANWLGRRGGKQVGQATGESKGYDDGYAAGLAHGKELGKSEGRDIGWQERADHQQELDKTHAEALALVNIAKGGGVIG